MNQCMFGQSDLNLLPKASMKPLSVGLPGRKKLEAWAILGFDWGKGCEAVNTATAWIEAA